MKVFTHSSRRTHVWLPRLRHLFQLGAFVLLPGLFAEGFAAVGQIWRQALTGTWNWQTMAAPVAVLLALFPLTILWGRFFCGFLCSFGALGDLLWHLSRRFTKRKYGVSALWERRLQYGKFLVLAGAFVLWTAGLFLPDRADPWHIFGLYTTPSGWTDLSWFVTPGAVLLAVIAVGSLVVERFFCRYLCPLGALFQLLSGKRLFVLRKPREHCGPCRLCTWQCSMGLDLTRTDVVRDGGCINCFECLAHCPKDNIKTTPAPALSSSVAALGVAGLYFAGNVAVEKAAPGLSTAAVAQSEQSGQPVRTTQGTYRDGIYRGSGKGFKSTIEVEVTVRGGKITAITVLSHNDTRRYLQRAVTDLTAAILATQDVTGLHPVTGATYSSYGFQEAVAKALQIPFRNPNYAEEPVLRH